MQHEGPPVFLLMLIALMALSPMLAVGYIAYRLSTRSERRLAKEQKVAEENRKTQLNQAQHQVRAFYNSNAHLLNKVYPASLLDVEIKVQFKPELSIDQSWGTAREFIAKMQAFVIAERDSYDQDHDRRRSREQAIQQVQLEKNSLTSRIAKLKKNPIPGVSDREIHGIEMRIRELDQQAQLLATSNV